LIGKQQPDKHKETILALPTLTQTVQDDVGSNIKVQSSNEVKRSNEVQKIIWSQSCSEEDVGSIVYFTQCCIYYVQ
jgi:hypothetical protein